MIWINPDRMDLDSAQEIVILKIINDHSLHIFE